jgi:hypothetical protein
MIRRGYYVFTLILFCLIKVSNAQMPYNYSFGAYLVGQKLNVEAKTYLKSQLDYCVNLSQKDSILHQLIDIYFNEKNIDSSISFYSQLNKLDLKDEFQLSFCLIYNKQNEAAKRTLSKIDNSNGIAADLKTYFFASIFLLEREYKEYDSCINKIQNKESYLINTPIQNLNHDLVRAKKIKNKSPLVAGTLSAVLPGLGKVYSHKYFEGLSGFLQNLVLGAMAYENYQMNGSNSARFYTFGSIFGLFYIGNIWGSSLAAARFDLIMNNNINDEIIKNMHLALRNYFKY